MVKKMKKKINVKTHTRKHPTKDKRVNVNSYERKIDVKPYRNDKPLRVPLAKGLTVDNLSYIQYKILEVIKLNSNYNQKTTMDDLYDELTFGIEDEKTIKEMVENLRNQGILEPKVLKPTNEGNRIFWEFYKEYEDGDHLENLKDNPQQIKDFKKDLKKEGFELIGTSTHPNETILYLKDLEKEANKIDKQLKENIKFKKANKKDYDRINQDQWEILEYIHYNMGIKRPYELSPSKIGDHLDFNENKVKKALKELRDNKILTPKQFRITKAGMKIKKSYEKQYDPDP